MQQQYRPTQVEVNLDFLEANIWSFRQVLPKGMKILACVKANAYGHGSVYVAQHLQKLGIDYVSVAFVEEGIQLRQNGIELPILIMGYTPPEAIALAWKYNMTVTVFSEEVLQAIRELNRQHQRHKLKVHIKIDTGMGRIGLLPDTESECFIKQMLEIEHVELEGIYTHFACADEKDKSHMLEQYRQFRQLLENLNDQNINIPIIHTGNTAVALDMPSYSYHMIRIGIGIYGLYPSAQVDQQIVKLQPVLALKTKIVSVRTWKKKAGISYGRKYIASPNERIATIPIGYADGYSRMLSGQAEVLIRGQRVPVVGHICMDQCMLSLQSLGNEAENVHINEEVVLIGTQRSMVISAQQIAAKLGTIPYEVICMLSDRVPRVYTQNNVLVYRMNAILNGLLT